MKHIKLASWCCRKQSPLAQFLNLRYQYLIAKQKQKHIYRLIQIVKTRHILFIIQTQVLKIHYHFNFSQRNNSHCQQYASHVQKLHYIKSAKNQLRDLIPNKYHPTSIPLIRLILDPNKFLASWSPSKSQNHCQGKTLILEQVNSEEDQLNWLANCQILDGSLLTYLLILFLLHCKKLPYQQSPIKSKRSSDQEVVVSK